MCVNRESGGINRIPVTLTVVTGVKTVTIYDIVNGKESGKSKHNYPIYLCSIYPL